MDKYSHIIYILTITTKKETRTIISNDLIGIKQKQIIEIKNSCSASIYPHRARRVFFHSLPATYSIPGWWKFTEIWQGTRESRIRARRIVASLCIGRCSRVGSQVKRVNAAALYLRPGHVRLPDYITARGNPEHSWWTPSVANCVLRPLTFRPLARGDNQSFRCNFGWSSFERLYWVVI